MPLSEFQVRVLRAMVRQRSEASHFAGGIVLNAPPDSPRFSDDFDVFHNSVVDLVKHSEADVAALEAAGFTVEKLQKSDEWNKPASFRRACVSSGDESMFLDWAHDSAFRFFPIVEDPVLGWRLHLFDMATNKALALASRTETRDYIDIVELGRIYSLEAICWAACGKDPGYSPLFLLKMIRRFARIDVSKMEEIRARQIDPIALKMEWMEMCDRAEAEMIQLADTHIDMPIGVAFVDDKGEPGWIGRNPDLRIHYPSMRGCWPNIPEDGKTTG